MYPPPLAPALCSQFEWMSVLFLACITCMVLLGTSEVRCKGLNWERAEGRGSFCEWGILQGDCSSSLPLPPCTY